MISNKESSIRSIKKKFEKLSNLVLVQMDLLEKVLATEFNEEIPADLLKKLVKNEKKIDTGEVALDDLIIQTMVLHKPVASELRQIFAYYRMVINLERIGDLVLKASNLTVKLNNAPVMQKSKKVMQGMLSQTSEMVNKSLLSMVNQDVDLAVWTIKKDEEVDEINKSLLQDSITKEDLLLEENTVTVLANLRTLISSIERIGDHAAHIAEASIYSLIGSNIKHQNINYNDF